MNLKRTVSLVLCLMLILGVAAIAEAADFNYNGKTKLSMFLPLTGDNMQYGIKTRDGSQMAVDQFNAEHGTEFTIEFFDDKGDPNEAVNIANKIVSDETVIAGFAGYGSSCAMATAPVFDEAEMILMGVAASHADLPSMGEYVFPIPMSQRLEAVEFANALADLVGVCKVAIIYQNTEHGVQACNIFKTQWESLGGEICTFESFVPGETKDFSALLSKAKEAQPDVLYVSAAYNDCAQAFLQANQLELNCIYMGPGMTCNEEYLRLVGNEIDGNYSFTSAPSFLPSVIEGGNIDEATAKFIEDYKALYNELPDGFSAQGYDSVTMVMTCALQAGSTDTAAIANEIRAIRSYPGLSGYNMCYNDQKEMNKGIYVFQIMDGSFVRIR